MANLFDLSLFAEILEANPIKRDVLTVSPSSLEEITARAPFPRNG